MLPLALLTLLSAVAAIAASLLGPAYTLWLFVFKPLTTLLVIAHAWRRGRNAGAGRQRRYVLIGLALSLAGDIALLWPREGFLPGLIAFLLAHLAYIAAFCVPLRLASRPLAFVVYAVVAALILSQLWPGIPAALRAPVVAYVLCLATMAAQAAAWWRRSAARQAADIPLARRAAIGGLLFMASDSLLAINKFALPLPLASWWILATYWLAQWAIASSLPAPSRPQGS
jgi:uncharacterized membrane protein YhhN